MDTTEAAEPEERGRWSVLPEPVRLVDTIASVDVTTAPDPEGGRDTDTDFVLRNA